MKSTRGPENGVRVKVYCSVLPSDVIACRPEFSGVFHWTVLRHSEVGSSGGMTAKVNGDCPLSAYPPVPLQTFPRSSLSTVDTLSVSLSPSPFSLCKTFRGFKHCP